MGYEETVRHSAQHINIKKNYGDTVAVEMEGRGFLEGVQSIHLSKAA
jgi:hypothetical protein